MTTSLVDNKKIGNSNKNEENRESWGNQLQFICTCVGYAVGLGNIWRFPKQAFDNGGGSFLIVYWICSLTVGFPILYLELSLGQFARYGPARAFGWLAPAFRGLGYSVILLSILVSCYYIVVVAWAMVYIVEICVGNFKQIISCGHNYNTKFCCSIDANNAGDCDHVMSIYAAEEFFKRNLLQSTNVPEDFGNISWEVLVALILTWIIIFGILSKGVDVLGKVSYVITTTPYLMIAILFFRGITLEGAVRGLKFYFIPEISKLIDLQTWKAAVIQNFYSLSIAQGGLLTLASYNRRTNNIFRDALIVNFADAFMSIFGGIATFSVLGHMSFIMDREVEDVIQESHALAFVAYPTAIGKLPGTWFWGLCFFLMLFMLGLSSMLGLVEPLISAVTDTWPSTRRFRELVSLILCSSMNVVGIIFTTRAGIFYFRIFDDATATISFVGNVLLELCVVVYTYGMGEYNRDLRTMLGNPKNKFTALFGPTSFYISLMWLFFVPVFGMFIMYNTFKEYFVFPKSTACIIDGKEDSCDFNIIMYILLATLSWSPLIIAFTFYVHYLTKNFLFGTPVLNMFRATSEWPAFKWRKVEPMPWIKRVFMHPFAEEVQNLLFDKKDNANEGGVEV